MSKRPGEGRFSAFAKDDRGEVPVFFVIFGTVFLLLYICIHGALVFHGQSVVSAAAQDALRAAQLEGGTEADGHQAANTTLAHFDGLTNVTVTVSQGEDVVEVAVTATVETPTFDFVNQVTAKATGPRERFVSEEERQ